MKTYKVSFDLSSAITHIGADMAGIGVEKVTEWVHSDTLFSAIIHAYARKFDFAETTALLDSFNAADAACARRNAELGDGRTSTRTSGGKCALLGACCTESSKIVSSGPARSISHVPDRTVAYDYLVS